MTDTIKVKELHYLPLPPQVTAQESVPAYPDRPLVNKDLPQAIADRDAVIARQNAKLAAAECLGDALPGSTQAKNCLTQLEGK